MRPEERRLREGLRRPRHRKSARPKPAPGASSAPPRPRHGGARAPRPGPAKGAPAAVALGLIALVVSPAGASVRGWVADRVDPGVEHAEPALTALPGEGSLLVQSAAGPWVVHHDGWQAPARRLRRIDLVAAWALRRRHRPPPAGRARTGRHGALGDRPPGAGAAAELERPRRLPHRLPRRRLAAGRRRRRQRRTGCLPAGAAPLAARLAAGTRARPRLRRRRRQGRGARRRRRDPPLRDRGGAAGRSPCSGAAAAAGCWWCGRDGSSCSTRAAPCAGATSRPPGPGSGAARLAPDGRQGRGDRLPARVEPPRPPRARAAAAGPVLRPGPVRRGRAGRPTDASCCSPGRAPTSGSSSTRPVARRSSRRSATSPPSSLRGRALGAVPERQRLVLRALIAARDLAAARGRIGGDGSLEDNSPGRLSPSRRDRDRGGRLRVRDSRNRERGSAPAVAARAATPPTGRAFRFRRLRAAVVRGARRDFAIGTGVGGRRYESCVLGRLREALDRRTLTRLVAVYRRPDGRGSRRRR